MPKYQYLISKYHWKSKKNVISLSADSTFSFSCRVKNENAELMENFLQHVYRKLHFPKSKKRSYKAASGHMPASYFHYDLVLFLKKKPLLLFFISKKQKSNEKKCGKDFLLHINIDSKCLNIGI